MGTLLLLELAGDNAAYAAFFWGCECAAARLCVKYERVYLKAYDAVSAARADVADYLDWYNAHRPHGSVERLTPVESTWLPPHR